MKVKITEKLDDLNLLVSELKKSTDVGGIAIFIGVVRGKRDKEKVKMLEYDSYKKFAHEKIKTIIKELKTKFMIIDALVEHRIGEVLVGENIMFAMVASKHRDEGFKALIKMVDRIKNEVPIWKKEITNKGEYWIENPKSI